MKQNILALDAAFGPACACLLRHDSGSFYAASQSDKPHSQALLPMLENLLTKAGLKWNDLQLLVVGIGPGSFTGLRVAAASIAGINAGLHLPVLKISSLAITSLQSRERGSVRVIEDARAGCAWLGLYQAGESLQDDKILLWDEILGMPAAACISHTESARQLDGWKRLPLERSRCEALAMLASQYADQIVHPEKLSRFVTPAYLCPSQAEHNAQKKKMGSALAS